MGHAAGDAATRCPATTPMWRRTATEAARSCSALGYGPDKRLQLKVSDPRHFPYRDPAVILIDHLRQIYIEAELELLDTQPLVRQPGAQGLQRRAEPTAAPARRSGPEFLRELRLRLGAQLHRLLQSRDWSKLFDQQSMDDRPGQAPEAGVGDRPEAAGGRRAADHLSARVRHVLAAAVKGVSPMVNSIYNGWRFEDVWLDR